MRTSLWTYFRFVSLRFNCTPASSCIFSPVFSWLTEPLKGMAEERPRPNRQSHAEAAAGGGGGGGGGV
jgi:hypothetical protein